jgi:osmotically inducible protein OsmC
MKFGSFEGRFSYLSRFEEGPGTNPEELIGAAHAGCFSMSLGNQLDKAGFKPQRIDTTATVTLEKVEGRSRITKIHLQTEARVPEISEEQFQEIAGAAKDGCPVSVALKGIDISLSARLVQ